MFQAKRDLESAQQELEISLKKTIQKIDALGVLSEELYESINSLQNVFDEIRGIPDDKRLQYQTLEKMRDAWKKQANDIAEESNKGTKNSNPSVSGIEIGYSVFAVTPSLACGLATCFETLSLGLLAPSLGGIPTLAVAIAIGTAPIADPVSLLLTVAYAMYKKSEKDCIQKLFTRIYDRNTKSYKRAVTEINARMKHMRSEKARIDQGIGIIKAYGTNYKEMSDNQRYELGTYMNLMLSSTALVVNPIKGVQPYYSDLDFSNYIFHLNELDDRCNTAIVECADRSVQKERRLSDIKRYALDKAAILREKNFVITNKVVLMYLCNLLYKIQIDSKEKRVLCKCLKENNEFAKTYNLDPKSISNELIDQVINMLNEKNN